MSTGKKSKDGTRHSATHGGRREGAGQKKNVLSISQLQRMLDAEKAMEDSEGISLDQILLNMAHGKTFIVEDDKEVIPSMQQRHAAIKLFKSFTMIQPKATDKTPHELSEPPIWLPEMDADPAKIIPFDKNKDE
jgi:hypothetical protein